MNSADNMDPFTLFSMRQVVNGCLDWMQIALKIVLEDYIQHGNPSPNPRFDLELVKLNSLNKLIASLINGTYQQ